MEPFVLDLLLSVGSSILPALGRLHLVVAIRANTYTFLDKEARAVVFERSVAVEASWQTRDFSVSLPEVEKVVGLLRALGFPQRRLRVREISDTLDFVTDVFLAVS